MRFQNRIQRSALAFIVMLAAAGIGATASAGDCGGKKKCDGASANAPSCASSCASAGASACKSACGSAQKAAVTTGQSGQNLVEVAAGAGSFHTLMNAVQAAGLVEVLKGEGPYTVFAPSDEAFARLPAGTVEALLKDKAKLAGVLNCHVVPGRLSAEDVAKLTSTRSVQGADLAIGSDQGVTVNGAHVVQADIQASNGVIHVIDAVILPEGIL